jgi:micrococcal nuclease
MGGKRRRFKVVEGSRQDPIRLWPDAKRKHGWSRYLPLWGGAVAIGLVVGLWPESGVSPARHTQSATREEQALAQPVGDLKDRPEASVTQAVEGPAAEETPPLAAAVKFNHCHTGGGFNCVVDGDTIWLDGQNIRIADIDAPETHEPRCPEELALGNRATQRLHQLVSSGVVETQTMGRDSDRFGRKLRVVLVDGVSVGETLVTEGLARWYEGGKRPWC